MAVIDIRGTHGSGKSTIVHNILSKYSHDAVEENGVHLGYHVPDLSLAILGRYTNVCGGCDGIKNAAEIERRLRYFAGTFEDGHKVGETGCDYVMLEGILVAHTFKRYSTLAKEFEGNGYGYRFLFLDTPLDVCLARVKARRIAKGNLKPLNPTNLTNDHKNIFTSVRAKCEAAGHKVIVLNHENPMPRVLAELRR